MYTSPPRTVHTSLQGCHYRESPILRNGRVTVLLRKRTVRCSSLCNGTLLELLARRLEVLQYLYRGQKAGRYVARVSLGVSRDALSRGASSSGVCGARGYDRDFPALPRQPDHPPWILFAEPFSEREELEAKSCKLDTIRDNLDSALTKRGVKVSKAVSTFARYPDRRLEELSTSEDGKQPRR